MITEMELEQFKKLAAAARGEKAEPEEAQALTEPEEKPEEASFVARPSLSGENKPLFSSLSFVESRKAEIEDEIAEERSAFLESEPLKEAPVGTFRRTASETAGNIWDAFTASSEADARAEAWEERAEAEEMFGETGKEARDALADAEKAAKEKEIAFFVSPFRAPARAFMEAHADTQDEYSKTAQGIRRTATAMTYFLTPEERLAKAEEVSRFTGIPTEAILSDEETWKRALFLYDYAKRKQAVADREGEDFSLEDVYAEFPKLKEIAGMSPAKAALALHDLKHIRAARDTFEAFDKAYERGQEYNEYGELLYKLGQYGEHQLTDKEKARLAVLREKMTEEPIQATFFEDPLLALAEGAGENLPLMVESFKEGEALALTYMQAGGAMGAAVGAAGLGIGAAPGAAAGTGAGAALGFLQGTARTFARYMLRRGAVSAARTLGQYNAMRRQSTGTTYEDYRQMRDADGNPLMTDREAWKEAQAPGAVNAAIELVEFKTLLGNVKGEYSKKLVAEIFRNGQKMMSGASAKKAAAGAAGGVLKGTAAEVAEEAEQSVSDDFFHNRVMDKYNGGEGKYTAGEMAERAFLSAAKAVPAALALGMGSTLGGAPASAWRFRSQSALWNQSLGSYKEKQRETLAGVSVLENLEQAAQDTKLKETAPEVLAEMIRAEAKGTPFETVYVDLGVLQEQGSTEDLEKLAKTAGFANVREMMENGVSVSMPVELYAQAEMSPEAKEAATFSPEADPIAVMRKKAAEVNEEAKRRMDAEIQKQIDLAEGAIAALFPEEGAVRDAAMASLYMNPENPAEGWKAAYAQAIAQRDEMLAPALEALERGMGQGTSVVETVNENGDVQTGRVSNNDIWYQEWFKEHGKAPTKGELRELARLMITGDASAPTVSGWSEWTNNKEAAEELAKNEPVLARLEQEIEALEAAKERMRTLSGAEMGVIGGMTPEAFRVYRETAAKLREGGMDNKEARMSAALFARHADIMAARMRKRGNEKYTAADYAKTVLFLQGQIARDADASMKGLKFAQAEMNRQKEEVRKRYEGTPGWMKAPNGRDTNLTEEQWLAARTKAFKSEYGDWEYIADAYPEIIAKERKDVIGVVKNLQGKTLKSTQENIEAKFSHRGLGKLYSDAAVNKSKDNGFSIEDHFTAVANIEKLFANSIKSNEREDENRDIEAIEHYSSLFMAKNNPALATFTVKVTNNAGRKIYSIEVMELKKVEGKVLGTALKKHTSKHPQATSTFDVLNISQIAKKYNSVKIPLDENGEPIFSDSPNTPDTERKPAPEREKQNTAQAQSRSDNQGGFSDGKKQAQFEIIQRENQMQDDIHTGIRSADEIKDASEVFSEDTFEGISPDFTEADAKKAMATGRIKVYSSKPIKNGGFVSTSRMMAKDYAGDGNIYEQEVSVDDVAWIDETEGQFAKVQGGFSDGQIFEQAAWHGSPHVFTQFDLGAIGTGEGAQAHGWGLYFAQDKEVSQRYREELIKGPVSINGKVLDRPNIFDDSLSFAEKHALGCYLMSGRNIDEAIKRAETLVEEKPSPETKEALEILKSGGIKQINETAGSLFQVEIPDDDVLLDEQKTFAEQTEKVRDALRRIVETVKRVDPNLQTKANMEFIKSIEENQDGHRIYNCLAGLLDTSGRYGENQRAASELLNQYGVKGITYEGGRDGRCFVVFDDKAIEIIDAYNQQANGGSKNQGGTARLSDGQRLVMLFENADKSTFVHEMGHVFLMDLEELAELGDEDARRDLDLIDDWAGWKGKGDAKKFAGSAWADEFRRREQAIIDAERAGNLLERDRLLVKWRHERFARAFELYLKEGKAPSKGLREVFRKFADWLRNLYYAFLSSGARASAQVEAVMGRMLATEEEIRWAEMDARYEDFTKAGGEQLLKEDAKTTISRWQEEAKAEAKERIMRRLMRDHTKAEKARREEILESRRAEKEKELQNQPVYLARNAIELTGDQTMWRTYFKTEAEWKAANRKALPMDTALADFVKEERRKMDKEEVKRTLTKEEIEEALSSSAYHVKLVQAEQQIFAEKMALIKKIGEKTQSAAGRVEDAIRRLADGTDLKADGKTPEVEELMKALGALKVSAKWDTKAGEAIERMGRAKTKEEIEKAFERFRKEHMERKLGLADLKKANEGEVQTIRRLAKLDMENMPIAKATAVNMYRDAERTHARRAEQMAKAGRWDVAASEKKSELRASFHAEEARKIRDRVDKILRHVKEQAKSKAKMPKDERYWHQHIAYLLRLVPDDAERPEGLKSLDALAKEMTDGLDVIGDENGNSELTALLLSLVDGTKKKETQEGYLGMTIGELADAANALTALYTVGKDKFKMKTFKGKTIRQCCDEMIGDEGQAGGFLVKRNVLTGAQDTGGVFWNELLEKVPGFGTELAEKTQRYALSLTKPEELIKLLGPKAHRYLYMTYDDAASREAVMTADAAARVEALLSVYTDEERRAWQDKAYSWIGVLDPSRKGELDATKEHVLAMALNMGNDVNMDRLMQGLAPEGTAVTESQVQMFVQAHMTEKDWKFVQGMWDLLHEYWPETVRVEMELNGTKLAPQEARPFTVETTGEDGRRKKLDLAGGYYPIAYDPKKSAKAGEQELNAEAEKGMYGAAVFGMGRSFTKGRAGLGKIQGRPLNLSLSVAQKHIGAVIHNITYRVAARDVYRMVNDKAFRQHVESTLGAGAYLVIRDWAMDNWKTPPMAQDMAGDFWNGALSHIRRHAGIAIMGYRLWPAVENATNIAPMMDYLGAAEAISAMQDYWGHKAEFDELLLKSVFMRQRVEHMDRDMRTKEDLFAADRKVPKWLREHAYWLMEKTDLATSAPLWCRVYKNSFSGKLAEVRRENEENKRALSAAQMKRDAVAAEIYDLKKREQAIEKELENRAYVRLPDAESEFAGQGKSELRAELGGLREEMREKSRELFIANEELDLAAELVIRTDAEILREAEHRAVQEADGAVRNVFGSGDVKDLSPVQKSKGEFIKALTMFYSYFNAQANAIMAANWQGKAAGASGMERWAPLAQSMAYRFLMTSVIGTALRMMLLREGDDDRDKYERDKKGNYIKDANGKRIEIPAYRRVLKQLAKNTLSTGVGTLYGVREAGNYLINRAFDGTDYGRSVRTDGMMGRFTDQTIRTASLFAAKWERDEKQKEKEAEEKEKYRRMTPKQRKRYDEEKKYRKPPNTISYADLLRSVGGLAVSVTAAQTGVTEPVANAVLGTMQYLTDSDGRYEASLNNILWSALWTKKPVKRTPPEKTETPEERKRRERKERRKNK